MLVTKPHKPTYKCSGTTDRGTLGRALNTRHLLLDTLMLLLSPKSGPTLTTAAPSKRAHPCFYEFTFVTVEDKTTSVFIGYCVSA